MLLQWKDSCARAPLDKDEGAGRRDLRTTAPKSPDTPVSGRRSMNML